MNVTPIFHRIVNSPAKLLILQGGTSSSKSYSAMQYALLYAATNFNKVITVTGESIPNLKKGAYRDVQQVLSTTDWIRERVVKHNESDRIIVLNTGSVIEFISNLDEQSAKAGKRDLLIADEADGIPYQIFFQLAIRTRGKIIIAYNPTAPFWAHEKFIGKDGNDISATVDFCISDHRHNTFLTEDEHQKIEGIKDPELWRVYARGYTGNLQGIIYTNWTKITPDKFPINDDKQFFGLDFGYENDPTAMTKQIRIGTSIFIKELAYQSGAIPPRRIRELLLANGYDSEQPVYCEHDPDQVRQLRMMDVLALPARKGPGSIRAGIQKIKEYNVYFVGENIEYERSKYMWMIDKDSGKPTNTPIDQFNHAMDAIRYAVSSHFYRDYE
jgi:phage terminase large subunit